MRVWRVAMFTFVEDWKIFLQERWNYSKFWEEWSFFGGHLEDREDFMTWCLREVKEELSIELSADDIIYTWEFRNLVVWESDYLSHIFICKKYHNFKEKIKVQEGDSGSFFSFEELWKLKMFSHDYMVCNNIKKFLENEV